MDNLWIICVYVFGIYNYEQAVDKVIKILTVEISRVVYNIVNKIDTYTQ